MLADYHVHTEFSDDCSEDMENVVRRAISAGITELCFTDHVDYGVKYDLEEYRSLPPAEKQKAGSNLNVDYPAYFCKIAQMRTKYKQEITIRQGLEMGIQTHTADRYEKLFAAYPLDFVLLSCHQVGDREFWNGDFQEGRTPGEYNARYYQEIYSCMKIYKNYSVLGHLDMIQRYNEEVYPFEASKEIITDILKLAIQDGKGIEVNTSSFRYGLKDLTPGVSILKLYHELGGSILTIGSDCHKAADVGDHIPAVRKELKKIGFTQFCTFAEMVPAFHPL